jgi:uncharacterized protein
MNRIFLDTGYLIALEASDDQHHLTAYQHWQQLKKNKPILVTTSYVFDEVTTFFNSRNRHSKAVEIGNRLLQSPSIIFIHVDEYLFEAGWKTFRIHKDKRYSLTDCVSFEVMEREGIQQVLSFDTHFEQAGFHRMPEA